jgi:SEC-C motif-containing protein
MPNKPKPGPGRGPRRNQPPNPKRPASVRPEPEACPCGSGAAYAACCRPLHKGEERAATAEQLMRSRFSAFAVGATDYLLRSWHSSTRPARLELDPGLRWTRLEIQGSTGGGAFHTEGTVEFTAYSRWQDGGGEEAMHENSSFVRESGEWVYVSAL